MAFRKLRYEEDSILRKRSKEVDIIDHKIVQLLDDMINTLDEIEGFGISAPQVGVLRRVAVIQYSGEDDEEEGRGAKHHPKKLPVNTVRSLTEDDHEPRRLKEDGDIETLELINPEIIEQDGTQKIAEACLSVRKKNGVVERPKTVTVHATNRTGERYEISAEGLLARGLCHEIDHLDGILFIDKATDIKDETDEDIQRKKRKKEEKRRRRMMRRRGW